MQGIFIGASRPKSKKQIKETVAADPSLVRLEATSLFGTEYEGPVNIAPNGSYSFVGPDPFVSRKFYGTVVVRDGQVTVK